MQNFQNLRFSDAHQRDCARVVSSLLEADGQSRASLAAALDLTSMTTSRIIADLLDTGFVTEDVAERRGRGRPGTLLRLNAQRIGFTVIKMTSYLVEGALLDLQGNMIASQTKRLNDDADNQQMTVFLQQMIQALRASQPDMMVHVGTTILVAGIVDVKKRVWLITSRWPQVRDFNLAEALNPVTPLVCLFRQLDIELDVHFKSETAPVNTAALLHWGWGIGLAYCSRDVASIAHQGPFGEIGHWRFDTLQDRPCGCGNRGCLETAVALPVLLQQLGLDELIGLGQEQDIGGYLQDASLADHADMQLAIRLVARTLGNMCRILFPDRVYLTGPFTSNQAVFTQLCSQFQAEGLVGALKLPDVIMVQTENQDILHSAIRPLIESALGNLPAIAAGEL
ncbi:ROK family protein [Ochrobactrum sp. GRS2]|nr:ROK family protein [Ochrobactrum sp. GRS2]